MGPNTPRAGKRTPRTPPHRQTAMDAQPNHGVDSVFHTEPFRATKPRGATKRILQDKDDSEIAAAPASPMASSVPLVEVATEAVSSTRPAAIAGSQWATSDHEGLLTLHDGNKRWYHCERCEYRNDRLYHSKMHFQRIHVKNGKSMPRKRKYVDGSAGTAPAPLPSAPTPRSTGRAGPSGEEPRSAEVLGVKSAVTPKRSGKMSASTPPRQAGSPAKSPKKEHAKLAKQRLTFSEPGQKIRRVGSSLKVVDSRRCEVGEEDDWGASRNSSQTVMTFRDNSIDSALESEAISGAGVSFKLGEMSSPASLPVGRNIIGAPGGARRRTGAAGKRGAVKREEEPTSPLQENTDANNWGLDHSEGILHASSSSARSEHGSTSKDLTTPNRTPVCSPGRPTSIIAPGSCGTLHTPLQDSHDRLRFVSRLSASPGMTTRCRTPTSNTLEMARSPGPARPHHALGNAEDFLQCDETLGPAGDCGLASLSDPNEWHASQVSPLPFPFPTVSSRTGKFKRRQFCIRCACTCVSVPLYVLV